METASVEPIHVGQGSPLGIDDPFKGPMGVDQLGFVKAICRLSQGIIIGIPSGAYRGGQPRLLERIGVSDGQILYSAILNDECIRSTVPALH